MDYQHYLTQRIETVNSDIDHILGSNLSNKPLLLDALKGRLADLYEELENLSP